MLIRIYLKFVYIINISYIFLDFIVQMKFKIKAYIYSICYNNI